MGWSSGSDVAGDMIRVLRDEVSDPKKREKIYRVLYQTLSNQAWDTVDEVCGIDPIFDGMLNSEGDLIEPVIEFNREDSDRDSEKDYSRS